MTRWIAGIAALLLAAAAPGGGSPVEAIDPRISEAPPVTGVAAGYMELRNSGGTTLTLTGVSSPEFERIEMHESMVHDGMSSMHKLEQVDIPARDSVSFAPGGLHFMLFGKPPLPRAGEIVPVTLRFSDGTALELHVPVRAAR